MKLVRLKFRKGFRIHRGNRKSQAAEMVIAPGDAEGDPKNRHRGADQWLFVVSGRGDALLKGRRRAIGPGSLLLIERGEKHEIRNTGRTLLRTVNFYVPPAYGSRGQELSRGKR